MNEQHKIISGALFDFLGFLTGGEKRYIFSATDHADPAVDALREWADKRGLCINDPKIEDWQRIAAQPTPTSAAEGVPSVDSRDFVMLLNAYAHAPVNQDDPPYRAILAHIDTKMAEQRQAGFREGSERQAIAFSEESTRLKARVRELEAAPNARAWVKVTSTLTSVFPEWVDADVSAIEAACTTIRALASRSLPTEAEGSVRSNEKLRALLDRLSMANRRDGWTSNDPWADRDKIKSAKDAVEQAEKDIIDYVLAAQPVPSRSDAECNKLLHIIANTFVIAGRHGVPEHILDVLAYPEESTQEQVDAMLPYQPVPSKEAVSSLASGTVKIYGKEAPSAEPVGMHSMNSGASEADMEELAAKITYPAAASATEAAGVIATMERVRADYALRCDTPAFDAIGKAISALEAAQPPAGGGLPILPEPTRLELSFDRFRPRDPACAYGYTADQMREYGLACIRASSAALAAEDNRTELGKYQYWAACSDMPLTPVDAWMARAALAGAALPTDLKQIAHLVGSIYFAGGFHAETANERELEALLVKTGYRYKSWNEVEAGSDAANGSKA